MMAGETLEDREWFQSEMRKHPFCRPLGSLRFGVPKLMGPARPAAGLGRRAAGN